MNPPIGSGLKQLLQENSYGVDASILLGLRDTFIRCLFYLVYRMHFNCNSLAYFPGFGTIKIGWKLAGSIYQADTSGKCISSCWRYIDSWMPWRHLSKATIMHEDEARQFLIYTYKLSFNRTPRDREIEVFLPKLLNDEFSPSQLPIRNCQLFHVVSVFCCEIESVVKLKNKKVKNKIEYFIKKMSFQSILIELT